MLIVHLDQKAKNMQRPKGGNEISQRHSDKQSMFDRYVAYIILSYKRDTISR